MRLCHELGALRHQGNGLARDRFARVGVGDDRVAVTYPRAGGRLAETQLVPVGVGGAVLTLATRHVDVVHDAGVVGARTLPVESVSPVSRWVGG